MNLSLLLLAAAFSGVLAVSATADGESAQPAGSASRRPLTEGWALPPREITGLPDPSKAWFAPVDAGERSFDVVKVRNAEGVVSFSNGTIRIEKTNDKGGIWVVAHRPFAKVSSSSRYRLSAEMEAFSGYPRDAFANVRAVRWWGIDAPAAPGLDQSLKQDKLICTAPGRPLLKAISFRLPKEDDGNWRAAICVEGGPSATTWRNLRVDSMEEVEKSEAKARTGHEARDFIADLTDPAAFDAKLAVDFEHTAQIVKDGDYAKLLVDGEPTPPIFFKGGHARTKDLQFGGKRMHEAGIPLLVAQVWPGSRRNQAGFWKSYWTTNGFDAAAAVADVKRSMLTAPDALYVLTIHLNAPAYWCDTHTNEIWRTERGEPVYGNDAHAFGPVPSPEWPCWRWPSYHSRVLRDETKAMLVELIAELKRTGLSKRIVGVHFGGYHDAQFTPVMPDWSEPARRAFAESGESDYAAFLKRQPMKMQEDYARLAREAFDKDIAVFRWCMCAFSPRKQSTHDIREFADSPEIDAIVPQVGYHNRSPGCAVGVKTPFSSFHLNGKLLVHEHDLRTYATWPPREEPWRRPDLSQAEDIDEWRSIDRKTAGQMIARRTGFWWYDFDKGSFDLPEIAADMASIVEAARPIYLEPPDPWRPTAAFVIDEADLLALQKASGENEKPASDIDSMVLQIALSGVPFDSYLKSDLERHPEIAARYAYLLRYDRNTPFMDARRINAEARAAGAYVPLPPGVVQVDMNGDFVSLHCLVPGRYDFLLPRECIVVNLKSGEREGTEGMVLPVEITAGETCWFRLLK